MYSKKKPQRILAWHFEVFAYVVLLCGTYREIDGWMKACVCVCVLYMNDNTTKPCRRLVFILHNKLYYICFFFIHRAVAYMNNNIHKHLNDEN